MLRIIIDCEHNKVADSLRDLANHVETTNWLEGVLENESNTAYYAGETYVSYAEQIAKTNLDLM